MGSSDEKTNTIEVIDLEGNKPCKNLPNFPSALKESFGGIGFRDEPIICSGTDANWVYSNKCFTLEGNDWIASADLTTARVDASVAPSPYPSKSQKLFVTGGVTGRPTGSGDSDLNTAEVLTENGWKTLEQTLPVPIYDHCSVTVNVSTLMVIGGVQNGVRPATTNTYYFNSNTEMWTAGPQLKNFRRFGQSCGRIRANSLRSQDLSIIVAGGYDGEPFLTSVEILDHGSNDWRSGPELPSGITDAQMVEDQNGGVVLVGGQSYNDNGTYSFLDTFLQLPHAGPDARWTKMEQKLKYGRHSHVAFLVPDNIVDCN